MIGIAGIVIGIGLLIWACFKGVSPIIMAPISGIIIGMFNGMDPLETFKGPIMDGVADFIPAMLGPVFLGMVTAALYNESGAARSIADAIYYLFTSRARKKAGPGEDIVLSPVTAVIAIYVIGCGLAFGGMNPAVMQFLLIPVAMQLFSKANMPREMIPGCVLGALATAACSMPGTTSDQNIIAVQMLGTSPMAGAVPGFIGGIFVLAINVAAITFFAKKEMARGNVYVPPEEHDEEAASASAPRWYIALIPMAATLITFNGLGWDILASLTLNIAISLVLFWKNFGGFEGLKKLIEPVPSQGCTLVLLVGLMASIGNVVVKTPAYKILLKGLLSIDVPPLFKVVIVMMVMTGATGSGFAALGAVLPNMADTFTSMGISLGALHRVACFSSQTLDTLPTNSGYIIASDIAQVDFRLTYKYVFVTTVINTTLAAFLVAALLTMNPGWA
jgi:H+/gluconate symporter-like permease